MLYYFRDYVSILTYSRRKLKENIINFLSCTMFTSVFTVSQVVPEIFLFLFFSIFCEYVFCHFSIFSVSITTPVVSKPNYFDFYESKAILEILGRSWVTLGYNPLIPHKRGKSSIEVLNAQGKL